MAGDVEHRVSWRWGEGAGLRSDLRQTPAGAEALRAWLESTREDDFCRDHPGCNGAAGVPGYAGPRECDFCRGEGVAAVDIRVEVRTVGPWVDFSPAA